MQNKTKKIELLAPAKNKHIAITAIDSGADAVYVGYSKFGARSAAGNSLEDIKEIIDYAHIFGVKVYVTLNTIFTDNEIAELEKLINNLYEINSDGIIIQDMGILELNLPPIPIIASTQCHNNTLEKIKFLEETGFKRVILPREFSLEEIKNISENTNIEIETFIHGALCVSYSGQCYLSQAIGGRSANRGECAQPCRKKYSLVDEKGKFIAKNKYLLSLKDFNLSSHLKDLISAGVTSFKIEGRLKDESYIKNVVSFYRKQIDSLLEELDLTKSSYGKIEHSFEPNLEKTFNRGYTTYFLNKRSKDISALNYTKSLGEFIGKVTNATDKSFSIKGKKLNVSDGICFFDEKQELVGTKIQKYENGLIFPKSMAGIKKGVDIYRNYDHLFETIELKKSNKRKIIVSLEVKEKNDNLIITIKDENGISTDIRVKNEFETAKSKENAHKNIEKQLSKLGGTEFLLNSISIDINNPPFIAVSELNSIRRELIEKFRTVRLANYKKEQEYEKLKLIKYPQQSLSFEANVSNEKAELFYEKRGVTTIEPAAELQKSLKNKKVMTTKHCLRYLFDICPKQKKQNYTPKTLELIDEHNKKYKLTFDCKKCEMCIYF